MWLWLVNVFGLLVVIFVVWWFWWPRKTGAVRASTDVVDIVVENGVYRPAVIQSQVGKTVHLRFLRKDEQPCAAMVVFDDFNRSAELPLGKSVDIELQLPTVGAFEFTCQMGMYRGRIIVTS